MAEKEYDLIVIGAGGAGSTAATTAARLGKRIALIERDKLGGTCLNYGCDPTKTLLHTAHLLYQARHASALGLRIPRAEADWAGVQAHVRQVQEIIRGGTPEQARAGIAAQGIDLFMGEAMFTSPHELRVNGEILRGERFVIATGTTAFIPDIEGLSEAGYITNVEAVALPELPKRLVVIGGGPIGLEFAQMFSRFGVRVVVIEREMQPLPREDRELAMALCSQLTAEGILPLSVSSILVEYPIKAFFRRSRPFIAFIQAIVIGRKPGSWSFPSGHSASAIAGAWLLSRDFPGQGSFFFLLAALVGFSRIYPGDHYPGDVLSGALSGMTLAESVQRVQQVVMRAADRNIG